MERNSILTSYIVDNELTCPENAAICNGTGCLLPPDRFNAILSTVLRIVITVMLALVMFSMGCTVDIKKFWGHIIRPWGIAIGFLCQFGIMPITAFVLSLAFDVHPVQAIVILIMGCCPGGTGSNILAYWVDGDMDLRLCLRFQYTFISTNSRAMMDAAIDSTHSAKALFQYYQVINYPQHKWLTSGDLTIGTTTNSQERVLKCLIQIEQ
ncbi:unnamed protein product [Ranitomeya imitator]|uniref:Ileal sodium/bile acid cotransporter n=1 Tax=Ranitomeya imitator TaxID=111125 RepID=A0ABN9KZ43_9NEOB|nr:unnamed protein product [Ranitomeya imitator]